MKFAIEHEIAGRKSFFGEQFGNRGEIGCYRYTLMHKKIYRDEDDAKRYGRDGGQKA